MSGVLLVQKNSLHLWQLNLKDLFSKEDEWFSLLNSEEQARAKRYHFAIHRQRYIATRGSLRQILSRYIAISAQQILFEYNEYGKPFLPSTHQLNFNVSHSDDIALIAITKENEIGVDIEKIQPGFKKEVAERFFSQKEYAELQSLSECEQGLAFYKIWTKKEAIIKALGKGLFLSLKHFSVTAGKNSEIVTLSVEEKKINYYVQNLNIFSDFQVAIATYNKIEKIELLNIASHEE